MSFFQKKLPAALGFNSSPVLDRACFAPALTLALAFVVLPLCLLLPFDMDRALPLLFVPAVWLSWKITRPAPLWLTGLMLWVLGALALSTAFADYRARALVMVSAVAWTLAGGMVARNLASCLPAVRLVLLGVAGGAALGAVLVLNGAGSAYMDFPLYWGPRIFGMHQFAGALAAIALFRLGSPKQWVQAALAALALALLIGVLTSGSRAALAGIAVLYVVWFFHGTYADRKFLLTKLSVLLLAAAAASYWIGQPMPGMGLATAVERTATAGNLESFSSSRSYFWSVVWHQTWDAPWLGHGADAYQFIRPRLHGAQPHNMLLQWLYEYGIFGAVPLTLLVLSASFAPLLRRGQAAAEGTRSFHAWAAAAVAGGAACGLFDGAFYHQVIFMALAVFAGFSLGGPSSLARPVPRFHALLRPVLLMALLAMMLHGWIGYLLMRAQNVTPDSAPARILRAFPSTVRGLDLWLRRWETHHPAEVMEWIKWAQENSNEQPEYHLAALMIHFRNHDFIAAEKELRACLGKVRDIEVPDIERLLADVEIKAREQAAAQSAQVAK